MHRARPAVEELELNGVEKDRDEIGEKTSSGSGFALKCVEDIVNIVDLVVVDDCS